MAGWVARMLGRDAGGRPAVDEALDCGQVAALLQFYLDDHLDDRRTEQIAAHLDACRRCGLEAETYERIKAALAARRPEVPAESVQRLREFGMQLARGEEPSTP